MLASRSDYVPVRGLHYHVRHWGRVGAPKIFMLHGWMDVAASFQFVVDCLRGDWHVIAPDWRGFGLSDWPATDTYWFMDYIADLEVLIQHYAGAEAINLVGHSMGGNIAGIYAGVRPARVRRLVNLEGFGLAATRPEQSPERIARWLDELQDPPRMRSYASLAEVAARLQKTNPRLSDARAAFLAEHWSAQNEAGEWAILGDPVHKQHGPHLYQVEEVLACWRATTAPVLAVEAEETNMWLWMGPKEEARHEIDRRLSHLRDVRIVRLPAAGHMLHHDQPEALATLIEDFLQS
ncbi:alpha/beta fold hydrolase [Massilia sp. TS11]|uniref:alpha/beta fold hydrolase n=1 Tax=Massilia sp. TS11 TaxID=2908003 RepID=UPI001EDC50FA|nr:alpha/beta hydrolase [Massilia sp. TS11]MCG2582958.1 alpha/beta hydrolase [Massilia sp. TS11]